METWISTVETSIQPSKALPRGQEPENNGSVSPESFDEVQEEVGYLKALIGEKDARIEYLIKENEFLYAELKRLRERIEDEIRRSDALIDQMQRAAEESSKRAHTIIMQLSVQIEKQAEQIEILQQSQGFSGAIRQKMQQLKAGLGFNSIRRALQSNATDG